MAEDFRQKIDAYLAEYYDPNGDAENDYALAWAKAFGERHYLTEDEGKKKTTKTATTGSIAPVPIVGAVLASFVDDLLAKKAETFSEKMLEVMKKHKLKATDVYKRAGITKSLFSKIKKDPEYHPSKDIVVAILMAMHATEEEGADLMARAGYTLSRASERDLIMRAYLEYGQYDVDKLNIELYDRKMKPLTGVMRDKKEKNK